LLHPAHSAGAEASYGSLNRMLGLFGKAGFKQVQLFVEVFH
jgi:hypothetical protein